MVLRGYDVSAFRSHIDATLFYVQDPPSVRIPRFWCYTLMMKADPPGTEGALFEVGGIAYGIIGKDVAMVMFHVVSGIGTGDPA